MNDQNNKNEEKLDNTQEQERIEFLRKVEEYRRRLDDLENSGELDREDQSTTE